MRRVDAANEGANGRQILTLPLLAARLAGWFLVPATQDALYPAVRQALKGGGFEGIGKVSDLPGMPAAVLSSLCDWWAAGSSPVRAENPRLRDFVLLERRVRDALPAAMLAPPDLVQAALKRLAFAPTLLGPVTLQDIVAVHPPQ
jgi:hypothetical protein